MTWPCPPLAAASAAAVAAAVSVLLVRRRAAFGRGRLRGRSVLVTGAGRGLGKELALACARKQCGKLLLVDLNSTEEAAQEARRCGNSDLEILTFQGDVASEEAVGAVCSKVPAGALTALLCAGQVTGKPLLPVPSTSPLSSSELRRTMDTNFFGGALFAQQLLPRMEQEGGQLIFISSLMGMLGSARLADYCASKWALLGFAESLRLELRARGSSEVGVMSVCPYVIDTGMFRGAFSSADRATLLRRVVAVVRRCVFPTLRAEEVAEALAKRLDEEQLVPTLVLPWHAGWVFTLLRLLPFSVQDLLLDLGGGCFGMESFQG
ncbi:unnamed protein product [Effrenium voratum]|uniref:Ketoreductase domain-containing protein n=1 Tax=Effrenium voratum TaxID=2562239 RepID=A0AA36N8V0_9DINO|nr:unnamed protein product [Effrenium voratum]CAJ1413258.1 unnamed protein product [Effrenium voratum]